MDYEAVLSMERTEDACLRLEQHMIGMIEEFKEQRKQ